MSNQLKNRIRIEGHEYDLCYCSAPEFALSAGIELPAPFKMLPGVKGRYKSLIIAGQFFAVIPVTANERKNTPLTNGIITDVFNWTKQEPFQRGWKFNKEFTGSRWFELYFDANNNDVKITCFRLRNNGCKTAQEVGFKKYIEEQVLFDGEINDIDDFEYICNLLHIQ